MAGLDIVVVIWSLVSKNYLVADIIAHFKKLESLQICFKSPAMDPHSRRSQFNHRAPKAGPVSRNIESPQTVLTSKMPQKKSRATATSTNLLIRRPIATNSRVKQAENFKRDMYLSVVSNALQQKINVRPPSSLNVLADDQ